MVVGKELEEFNKKLEAFLKYISENKLGGGSLKNKSITPDIALAIKEEITTSKENLAESISYSQAIKQLEDIYFNTHYRHAYSTITKYVVSQKIKCLEGRREEVEEDILQTMSFNIENIFEKIILKYKENVNNSDEKAKHNFIEKVFKLKDHINLEIFRLQDIIQSESEYHRKITETEKTILGLKEDANGVKKAIDDSENNLKGMQREYITILGIFASIIIAFVANMTFSSSILQNIDKPNTFKLVSIMCFLGIFIVNILNILFNFIREIHFGRRKNSGCCSKIWFFNIIIILIATICLIKSLNYDERITNQKDSNSTININTANIRFSSS